MAGEKMRVQKKLSLILSRMTVVAAFLVIASGLRFSLWMTEAIIPIIALMDGTVDLFLGQSSSLASSSYSSSTLGYYSSDKERDGRHSRFPSVQDRAKIYMGPWYTPPCEGSNFTASARVSYSFVNTTTRDGKNAERWLFVRELVGPDSRKDEPRTFVVPRQIVMARVIRLDWDELVACDYNPYCEDTRKYLQPALDRDDATSPLSDWNIPTILQ
jgi:hypothetical protein